MSKASMTMTPPIDGPVRPDCRGARWAIGGVATLLFTYTTIRAFTVSFSWDESWTFIHYVLPRVLFQDTYDQMGANHHLFNVWAMIASHRLFGASEIALRLPNLLAHVLFLYTTARIALSARSGLLAVPVFLLLNVHPYLLDFFSLARGYGLACAWMMLSLWQAFRYFREEGNPIGTLAWGLAGAILAAMSHLIMVNYLLCFTTAIAGVWLYRYRFHGKKVPWKHMVLLFIGTLAGLVVLIPGLWALWQGGSLYFGCDTWWECTMGSLGAKLLYHQPYHTPALGIMLLALLAWAGACLFIAIAAWKGGWADRLRPMAFGVLVLATCLAGLSLQQKLFGVPLPQSRTALFLVPLAMYCLAAGLVAYPRPARLPTLLATVLCLPLLVHQWNSLNLAYAVEWKPSGEVRHLIDIIERDHLPLNEQRPLVTVASSDECWGVIPYYAKVRGLNWLSSTHRVPPDDYVESDYYIVEFNGYDHVDTLQWEKLYFSSATGTSLYRDRRLSTPHREVLFHVLDGLERPDLQGASTDHWASGQQSIRFDSLTRSVDTLRWIAPEGLGDASLLVTGTLRVLQQDDSNWMALVAEVVRDGQVILQRVDGSNPQLREFGRWGRVAVELRVTGHLQGGDVIRFWTAPMSSYPPIYADDLELWISR